MKTLHLNLKSVWFDMTLRGIKTEEYRDLTSYWNNRLTGRSKKYAVIFNPDTYKKFDTITFSNGYAKDRPQFVIEHKGIEIREGNPEWGAEPGKNYFVLLHGKIVSMNDKAKERL